MAHAKIKGTRKGLRVLDFIVANRQTVIHKLYDTDIITIQNDTVKNNIVYTSVFLNSGGWRTNHTKNCMNDVLTQFNLKVIQRDFSWYLVDSENTIAWDFEDGMSLGVSFDDHNNITIVKWGEDTHMRRFYLKNDIYYSK